MQAARLGALANDELFADLFRGSIELSLTPRLKCTCGGEGDEEIRAFAKRAAAAGSIFFYDLQPGVFENAEFYEREAEPIFQKSLTRKYKRDMCPCVALRESEAIKHWTMDAEKCALRVYDQLHPKKQ